MKFHPNRSVPTPPATPRSPPPTGRLGLRLLDVAAAAHAVAEMPVPRAHQPRVDAGLPLPDAHVVKEVVAASWRVACVGFNRVGSVHGIGQSRLVVGVSIHSPMQAGRHPPQMKRHRTCPSWPSRRVGLQSLRRPTRPPAGAGAPAAAAGPRAAAPARPPAPAVSSRRARGLCPGRRWGPLPLPRGFWFRLLLRLLLRRQVDRPFLACVIAIMRGCSY